MSTKKRTELDEIAEYYDTHDTAAEMEGGTWHEEMPSEPQSVSVSVRFTGQILEALRERARSRGVGYTTLIREMVEAELANADEPVPASVIMAAVAEYQHRKAS